MTSARRGEVAAASVASAAAAAASANQHPHHLDSWLSEKGKNWKEGKEAKVLISHWPKERLNGG